MLKYAAGRPLAQTRGAEARRSAIKCFLVCSAGPRGLCGDPRIFDDLTKVPQVSRNPGGSPALQNERPIRCHEPLHSDFFMACWTVSGESAADAR